MTCEGGRGGWDLFEVEEADDDVLFQLLDVEGAAAQVGLELGEEVDELDEGRSECVRVLWSGGLGQLGERVDGGKDLGGERPSRAEGLEGRMGWAWTRAS